MEYLVKMQTSLFFVEVEREARVVVRVVVAASLSKKVQRAFPLGKNTKLFWRTAFDRVEGVYESEDDR